MNSISSEYYNSLGLGAAAGAASEKAKGDSLGQADFLLLMTEQLKNQDPLKPLDNNQFLGQLAQFSTVQGIDAMQGAMGAMASIMESDQTLRAASLVGHDALVSVDQVPLEAGAGLKGEVVAVAAGPVTMDVVDANGVRVRRMTVEAPAAGPTAFEWDGRTDAGAAAPAGTYGFRAVTGASDPSAQGADLLPIRASARVESVSIEPNGLFLNLAGMGSVPLSAIHRIG